MWAWLCGLLPSWWYWWRLFALSSFPLLSSLASSLLALLFGSLALRVVFCWVGGWLPSLFSLLFRRVCSSRLFLASASSSSAHFSSPIGSPRLRFVVCGMGGLLRLFVFSLAVFLRRSSRQAIFCFPRSCFVSFLSRLFQLVFFLSLSLSSAMFVSQRCDASYQSFLSVHAWLIHRHPSFLCLVGAVSSLSCLQHWRRGADRSMYLDLFAINQLSKSDTTRTWLHRLWL